MYWLYWAFRNNDGDETATLEQFDTLAEVNRRIVGLKMFDPFETRIIRGEEIPIVEDPK